MSQETTPSAADIARALDRDRLIERLRDLVRIESENPPGNEAEVASLVAGYCESAGFEVSTHDLEPGRTSVVARRSFGPGPTVCYCSHIDVVPAGDRALWEWDPYGAEIAEGRMHGRGSADAKGPVAAAVAAAEVVARGPAGLSGTLELALVADEEAMGFKGAAFLVGEGVLAPDFAIVGEPTSLRVVRAQRGACWMRIVTRGKAAHGSAPERGVNAISHMAEIVLRLEETLPDITHPIVGAPTISVGTIRGGEKVNIVPAACIAEVDRRSIPGETEESIIASVNEAIELARKRFPDIDATVELPFYGRPFEIPEESRVVQEVVGAVREVDEDAKVVGFRGASDARFFAEAGAEVVLCGPGDIALAHTARESIDLDELERGAIVYALAFARLLG